MLFSNQIGKGFTNYGNAFHFWRDHIRAKKKTIHSTVSKKFAGYVKSK